MRQIIFTIVFLGVAVGGTGMQSASAFCGDGVLDPEEQCDDGSQNDDTEPDACRTDCRTAYCGDGVVDTGEQCDESLRNSDYEPDTCRSDCRLPYCGDGVKDPGYGEQCDEGEDNSDEQGASCSTNCVVPGCGNGVLESWEACDDGNQSDQDSCTSACERNVCGDGFIWMGVEYCEYEQPWDAGDCRYDCGQDASVCGNGTVDPGETCDDGADRNEDTPDVPCRTDCQPQRCGDGIVDTGEECDLQEGCAPDCTWIEPR